MHTNNDRTNIPAPNDGTGNGWQTFVWTLTPGVPVGRALVAATERLRDAGSPTASLDAQVILAHALGVERSWLFAHYDHELDATEAERYTDLIARRGANEPVAYLVGHKEFYGIDLAVDRRVLIPRPETELLVDAVFDYIDGWRDLNRPSKLELVDVGTGSGAIALAIASETSDATIHAIDISADALDVARLNAHRLGLAQRIAFHHGDLLAPLTGPVNVIVANLPYIRHDAYRALDADVHDYEPRLALDAGKDGLESIRRLLAQAPRHLRPGGMLLLEIGSEQGRAVAELAHAAMPNAMEICVEKDYSGLDRIVRIML